MTRRARVAEGDACPLVERFATAAIRFGPRDRREKLALLARLATCPIAEPDALLRLHESLCYLQAYADDGQVLAAVNRALDAFPARIAQLGRAARHRLRETGIAGTALHYPFGFPIARWLALRFHRNVAIDWKRFTADNQLQQALGLLVHPMEEEAFSEFGLDWQQWLRLAKGGRRVTDLQLLVELFKRGGLPDDARDSLFESLELPITWTLHGAGASRTLARVPGFQPFFPRCRAVPARTVRDPADARREIVQPLHSIRRAPRALGARIVGAARAALALRSRELHGISYANPDDVLLANVGNGLKIALIGVLPRHRLPLESFFGYLALRNGVPIAYGGAWQLFGTLEYGVNIFRTFRRGESIFIATQALRLFHHALGTQAVVLQPFQIGQGNPEAIESAAFHFYYRLGFRPDDPDASRLAEREQASIARSPSYRTPVATLRRLAEAEMFLNIAADRPPPAERLRSRQLAALVTDHVARNFGGDRDAAARAACARLERTLGVTGYRRWPPDQQWSFQRLSLLAALVPGLETWGVSDRIRLVRALRAKGATSEVPFVRLLDGHRRFREGLRTLVARRAAIAPARPSLDP